MSLTEFQRASFRHHLHSANQIIDPDTGEAIEPGTVNDTGVITAVIDGGGSAITTGIKLDLSVDFDCTLTSVTALADQSGSIQVDIWKDTYANYPPVNGDSITASTPVTISAASKSRDTTLTGWTTAIASGDTLRFNVDSATSIQRVTIVLAFTL